MPDLRPEPEIGPDSVRFVQTTGGVVGFPTPPPVPHQPNVQIRGPMTLTTLYLTNHTDGTVEPRLVLRHYVNPVRHKFWTAF